ncbi:MFS transporter [Actinomadura sp. 9N407]|uniref:MFS transporter n=1 Tax=Actinomadura sp. 9N407 TaxID=3375154 RepID=UPI00379564EE
MTVTTPPGSGPKAPPVASVSAVVGLLILFEFVSGLLQGGIAPILPSIGDLHDVSDSALTWVVSVQLLAAAVSVPAFGRLGDLHGHRRMLRIALISVAIGSVLVAIAPTFEVLLAGRLLQGPLAALLPLEIALVRDRLPVELARKAIARLVGALAFGGLIGALGLGMAEEALGIQGSLWVAAALSVICVPVCFIAVPESQQRASGRADWPGIALLSLSMLALMAGVSAAGSRGWLSAIALVPILAGVALLIAWTVYELRTPEPLVDLRAMAGRHIAPFYATSFVFGVLFFGAQSPNATFLATKPEEAGYGFGLSALSIALIMVPATIASVVGSTMTAVIARKLGGYRRTLVISFGMAAVAFVGMAVLHDELWQMATLMILMGLGMGAALGAMPTVIVEATEPTRTGIATALYNNIKTLGGALAGGIFGTVLSAFTISSSETVREGGYVTIWLACALCAALAVVSALIAQRKETTG